jgi:hypothetical protein
MLGAFALMVSATAAWSQDARMPRSSTLAINLNGTAGPVLAGSDPGHLNGKSAVVTILLSQRASPISHTSTSATYKIPAGAITATFNGTSYQSTSPGRMKIKLGSAADVLTVTGALSINGTPVTLVDTSRLAGGSWTSTVLTHPAAFSPSPQNLTPAKTATGAGSKLQYTVFGQSTVLGITGTASSNLTPDAILPNDDTD